MSVPAAAPIQYNKARLYWTSSLALFTAGVANALRSSTNAELQHTYLDPIDKLHSAEMVGTITSIPFLAFAITIAVSSPLLDIIGMGLLLPLAAILIPLGMALMGFAGNFASGNDIYWVLWIGAAIAGVGWGLVETVMNPLIASLYTDDKTAKLNAGHAWWPGGLVIGGLAGLWMSDMQLSLGMKMAIVVIPSVVVLAMALGVKYPPTERAASGASTASMFKELANPLFIVLFLSMFLTAASELAPGSWVDLALSRTVGMRGIVLLVYGSCLMFLMRHFAGPLVHKLSPIGVLWFSSLGAALGLVALSYANSPAMGLLAATLWGTGVCYMWPTMLATASERFPRGGALLMGLMGTAGTLSIRFVLPMMGSIYDTKKIELAGGEAAYQSLTGDALSTIEGAAGQASFRAVAILPAILLVVFGAIWLYDRSKGGYKPQKL